MLVIIRKCMLGVIRIGEMEMFLLWEDGDDNSFVEWMIICQGCTFSDLNSSCRLSTCGSFRTEYP